MAAGSFLWHFLALGLLAAWLCCLPLLSLTQLSKHTGVNLKIKDSFFLIFFKEIAGRELTYFSGMPIAACADVTFQLIRDYCVRQIFASYFSYARIRFGQK